MAKKQSLANEIGTKLYNQYYKGKGTSRHADKLATGKHCQPEKIYSRGSIKTHKSQGRVFAKWLRANHPEVRRVADITREQAIEYVRYRNEAFSPKTSQTSMSIVNRLLYAENGITRKECELPRVTSSDARNNRGPAATCREPNERQREVLEYGRAFGLRHSEMVYTKENPEYQATEKSLYEKDGTLYHCTFGKGGLYRSAEILASQQMYIEEAYGEMIQHVTELPTAEEFKEIISDATPLFDANLNNLQAQQLSRQYYANNKMLELEQSDREWELFRINQAKNGSETYEVNGIEFDRGAGQWLAKQMGHSRISESSKYLGTGIYEEFWEEHRN
ncbi:hypothetical protein PH235_14395 [Trichococcus sp. K1Tr]|uniref:hypothetical protein n=1 Tax=Trichococcus sp. K1Tr TaxID=3020847 RepID=UPI00232AD6C3|nr:hypothetical protein [Trichococcus sp. K1Tr]MDB6354717.1 hypothetical protein [Trichococcus sp. K1Tr]